MTDGGEEQAVAALAAPPNEEEEVDLVALLTATPEKVRFFLPTRDPAGALVESDRFYVEGRMMTGAEHQRYLNTGMQYRVATGGSSAPREATFSTDTEAQTRALLELSLTDYLLPIEGKETRMSGRNSVWPAFSKVPAPVLTWVVKKLRALNGLEVTTPAGEA